MLGLSPAGRMFNLSRYFSTLSLILIIVSAGLLGLLYRQLSLQHMTDLAESRNLAMAQVFENSLRSELDALMRASVGLDESSLRGLPEASAMHASVLDLMRKTAVVKVKMYNRLGVTIFSTDIRQVGENRLDNLGFRTAISGKVISELTHRDRIDTFEGTSANIDLLSSYIPLLARDRSVEGVFELYQDVSPFVSQLERSLIWMASGVVAVFGMLYLMQYLVVRRAQRILHEQEGRIAAARDTLGIQVEARTDELKRANRKLHEEVLERRHAEGKLNFLAYHDPLTGLANRRCFIERLEQSLDEAGRRSERLAVLFIDLDQFKQVNDSLGHGVGDELLISVAARLQDHVRLIDMLARLGGDEFICLMEAVRDEREVEMLAKEVISAFEFPFQIGENELFLSASVGISLYPEATTVADLLRNADTAMYRAKASGRGRFHFYTADMTLLAQERIKMESLLRRALENGEMSVHLQPQVDTRSGRLVGAEALVRWNSPQLGLVMPGAFIPLAEESGMIVSLGNWVLHEACRQMVDWEKCGFFLPKVSVNLSVKQLERPEFINRLAEILDETGMDATRLKLELTETMVMKMGDASRLLGRLREFGISLALDDFGTGYSSLSYLKLLPVQQLKIDRSFVTGIGVSTGDEAIIQTIMALARSMDFEVVAEGVETTEQADFLRQLGCQQLQGYLHGRAVDPGEFLAQWSARQ